MRYIIVGIIKKGKETYAYEVLPIGKNILNLKAATKVIPAEGHHKTEGIEFANAEIENGKIRITIGSPLRYPQYTMAREPIETKYAHAYKGILVGRCAVHKSGKLKEGIIYINGALKAYTYDQLKELKDVLESHKGCLANATIRENGTPEITTWNLTPEQRKKALFIYARPVLLDLVKANGETLQKIYKTADDAIKESARMSDEETKVNSDKVNAEEQFKDCIMQDGTLIKWMGDMENPVIPEGVETIGESLFAHNMQLKSVTLPSTVKKISPGAFMGCIDLREVKVDKNNIEDIGMASFFGTRKLKSYSLSPKTTTIGDYAFCGSGLEKIDLIMPYASNKGKFYKAGYGVVAKDAGIEILDTGEEGDSEVIKDINIGYGAFAKNNRLTSVEFISDKPLNIGARAFEDCGELKSIKGDYLVRYIGDSAFEGTSDLTDVKLENLFSPVLEHIGNRAFRNSNISGSIKLYKVKNIGDNAFESVALDKVTIYTDNLQKIGDRAFEWSGVRSVKFVADKNTMVKEVKLGDYCFADCERLHEVDIQKGVSITEGQGVFSACNVLDTVNLGSTKVIPKSAFLMCGSLCTVDLTDIDEVKDMAFSGTGLQYVVTNAKKLGAYSFAKTPLQKFVGENVTYVRSNAFSCCSRLTQCLLNKESYIAPRAFSETPMEKRYRG